MAGSKGGKTMIIFLVLIVIILTSGVAISLFLLNKETQTRKATDVALQDSGARIVKIESFLKEAQTRIEVLTGKNKDADEKINSLMSEIDLEAALRDELKAENKKLKDLADAETKAKQELKQKLTAELEVVQTQIKGYEAKLSGQVEETSGLKNKIEELEKKNVDLQKKVSEAAEQLKKSVDAVQSIGDKEVAPGILPLPGQSAVEKVNLDQIVIAPQGAREGRVLNVDTETEFLIFDLGLKHGIKQSDLMSVYRGKSYLGDVKVSRVQDEMSAADLIPPFSTKKVRKNDQVVPKR